MSGKDRHPITEPRIVLLALGAVAVVMLCIVAIAETSDVWLVVLTFVAVALIGAAIAADLGRVIAASSDAPAVAAPAPGSVVVVSTAAMTAEQVLDTIGPLPAARSIMVVAPEG